MAKTGLMNLLPAFTFLCCKIHSPSFPCTQYTFAFALASSGCDFAHLSWRWGGPYEII